jgi:hypothetical protein
MQYLRPQFFKLVSLAVLVATIFYIKVYRMDRPAGIVAAKVESLIDKPTTFEPKKLTRKSRNPANKANTKINWDNFKKKYGEGFEPEYNDKGELVRITAQNSTGKSKAPTTTYSPTNREQVIQRAQEILSDLEDLLGLQNELPLQIADVQTGNASSQVFLREQMGTVPIYPMGTLTIDLGADGQLLGLSSSYLQSVQTANERTLTPTEAALKAGITHSTGLAQSVIWATGFNGPFYHAYQYQSHGEQVIIDASSGTVIYKRDKRQF